MGQRKELTEKMKEQKDVRPIKDKQQIEDFKFFLKRQLQRDYIMFYLGINVGLRISDLLNIKVEEVRGKKEATIREAKTGKTRKIYIKNGLCDELNAYIATLDASKNEYLFPSRQGGNKPIGRIQAWQALNKAAKEAGIEHVGTHSMRKTYGYHYYTQKAENGHRDKALSYLQHMFNHTSSHVTLKYIGITEQEIEESLEDFHL